MWLDDELSLGSDRRKEIYRRSHAAPVQNLTGDHDVQVLGDGLSQSGADSQYQYMRRLTWSVRL